MKETQKKITIYEAFDGKEFLTEQECMEYEQEEKAKRNVLSSAKNIIEYCKKHITATSSQNLIICQNTECPFFDNKVRENCTLNYPYSWKCDLLTKKVIL